jgi:hypothetical protein
MCSLRGKERQVVMNRETEKRKGAARLGSISDSLLQGPIDSEGARQSVQRSSKTILDKIAARR